MKKSTTSDQLKQVFETVLKSDPDDWKRVSKSKNDEGQWVREFENRDSGARVTVTEMEDGTFNISGKGAETNISLGDSFAASAAPGLSKPDIMYGTLANEAADKAIAIIMNDTPREDTEDEDFEDSEWGVPKETLDTAGKALANRYCFAINGNDDEGMTANITPIRFYQEEGHCSDQTGPVSHLLPDCGGVAESTWECSDPKVKTPVDFAQHLQKMGFQWSRDFQDYIDASHTEDLSKHVAAMEDKMSPGEAADQVMKIVLEGNEEGNDEVPDWLLKQADPKALASKFYFTVYDMRDNDGDLVAVVAPKGMGTDESKKSYSVMYHLFPEVQYIDDCVEGWWAFPASIDTPLKLAQKLVDAGFEYNAEYQDEALKPQLAGLKLPGAGETSARQAPPKP